MTLPVPEFGFRISDFGFRISGTPTAIMGVSLHHLVLEPLFADLVLEAFRHYTICLGKAKKRGRSTGLVLLSLFPF